MTSSTQNTVQNLSGPSSGERGGFTPLPVGNRAGTRGYPAYDTCADNARLIAAAPEMFEALKAARNFLCEQSPNNDALLDMIDAALSTASPDGLHLAAVSEPPAPSQVGGGDE